MKLLLIGLSTRHLAESALESGYDFITLDYFGDLDQKRICENYSLKRDFHLERFDPKDLFLASQDLDFDAIVYSSPFENHPKVIREFEKRCLVIGNSSKTLSEVRDWGKFFDFLAMEGIDFPATIVGVENIHGRYLVKPIKGGGGTRINIYRKGSKIKKPFLLQKQIKGKYCSASFISDGLHCEILSVNEQLVGKEEFGAKKFWYCGNITPLAKVKEIDEICSKITKKFGLKGSNGIDFILKGGKIHVLEVNPRFQASMEIVENAYGINIFDLHVKSFHGELPCFDGNAKKTWGKAILYAERDVILPDTRKWIGRVKDIPYPAERIEKGHPICTIIASGEDREECWDHLVGQASALKGELYR
ncbi:MAG: ATP-grasp domain-containing protein [Methanocellales archaeon]|nr:ATP-grasp domain-containing protein [Methanocellales archaeon]